MRLVEELKDRWTIETQALLVGWHVAGAMSDGTEPLPRPDFPEWPDVKETFDRWLISDPEDEGDEPEAATDPALLDTMIAFGWKD